QCQYLDVKVCVDRSNGATRSAQGPARGKGAGAMCSAACHLRLLEQDYVRARNLPMPAIIPGELPEGFFPVEGHVSRVATIVPLGEAAVVGLERGHDSEPTAGF